MNMTIPWYLWEYYLYVKVLAPDHGTMMVSDGKTMVFSWHSREYYGSRVVHFQKHCSFMVPFHVLAEVTNKNDQNILFPLFFENVLF